MGNSRVNQSTHPQVSIEMSSESSPPTTQTHSCNDGCPHKIAQQGNSINLYNLLTKLKSENDWAEINLPDEFGRTVLHYINSIKCNCETCLDEAERCISCLVCDERIDINAQDADGNTGLHLAILSGNAKCAKLLLAKGADVSIRNNNDQEPLVLMAQHSPEVMISVLNQAVNVEKYYPNSKDCVLRLDFGAVIGYANKTQNLPNSPYHRELSLLTSVLCTKKSSRKLILTHPLVVLFLDQKWRRVRKYFATVFVCYIFWLLAYTSFIVKVYLVSCPCEYFSNNVMKNVPKERGDDTEVREFDQELSPPEKLNRCHLETGFTFDALVIIMLTLIMAINEIVKAIATPKLYIRNKLNIGSWGLILMVTLTIGPVIMEKNSKLEPWQYQAAALAIFLSWAFILQQLGSIPSLGKYVEILGHVLKNFGLSMLTFSALFIAFALSFNVLFPGTDGFSHLFFAILKCIVMFIGEVDYQDMFYDKNKDSTTGPIVGHVLYAAFVLIVTIVLMNLLVGLTVSDIQTLQQEAELSRIFRQISEMLNLELISFSNRLGPIGHFLQKTTSVTGHKKHTSSKESLMFRIRPNDPMDTSVPEELKESMLKIAICNYHRDTITNINKSLRSDNHNNQSDKSVHFRTSPVSESI